MPGSFQELLRLEDILITAESFLERSASGTPVPRSDAKLQEELLQKLAERRENRSTGYAKKLPGSAS